VSLLDLAVGILQESGGDSPLFIGYDRGYDRTAYPGLFDPAHAGDLSPLINAMEAHDATGSVSPAVDTFPVRVGAGGDGDDLLAELMASCWPDATSPIRDAFHTAAWRLLEASVQVVSPTVLHRVTRLTRRHRPEMDPRHRRMDDIFRRYAGAAPVPSS
jgi:hypothetical protein